MHIKCHQWSEGDLTGNMQATVTYNASADVADVGNAQLRLETQPPTSTHTRTRGDQIQNYHYTSA